MLSKLAPCLRCACRTAVVLAIGGVCAVAAHESAQPASVAATTRAVGDEYSDIMVRADQALLGGHAVAAAGLYENAAQLHGEHVEAEISLSRAWMAAGEFRRALSYAHLASGEHADSDPALAWLAYLEDRAGYADSARARLGAALERWPAPSSTAAALAEILIEHERMSDAQVLIAQWPAPVPAGIARLQLRMARAAASPALAPSLPSPSTVAPTMDVWPGPPFAVGTATFNHVLSRSNGVVVNDGRQVLTRALPSHASHIVVRDARGKLYEAKIARAGAGVALLSLATPVAELSVARITTSRPPDGARFCFVLGQALLAAGTSAYPALTPAVIVREAAGVASLMQLSAPLTSDHGGSPVFDVNGHLIGLALGAHDRVAGVDDRRQALGDGSFAIRGDALAAFLADEQTTSQPAASTPSVEELYERLAPAVVEVWVLAGGAR